MPRRRVEACRWHFDTNNYTVTLCIQNSVAGGDYEYCAGLRTPVDENYTGIAAVLDGQSNALVSLTLEPGDLQTFKGRYSLHRVKSLSGARNRYMLVLDYRAESSGCEGVFLRAYYLFNIICIIRSPVLVLSRALISSILELRLLRPCRSRAAH